MHTPVRQAAVRRRSNIHDEEPDTKNIILGDGDENVGEDKGLVLAEVRARKEDEDIVCGSILGKNLHDAYSNERFKLAFNRQSMELLEQLDESGFEVPTRWTLSRSTIKLAEAACMHARTKNASDDRPVTRYINPDGSPKGRELYLMKYWEVRSMTI